jgi:hypothetical protein
MIGRRKAGASPLVDGPVDVDVRQHSCRCLASERKETGAPPQKRYPRGKDQSGTSYIVFVKRKSKNLKNIFQNSFLENGPSI